MHKINQDKTQMLIDSTDAEMLGAVPKEEAVSAPLTGVHMCFHSSSPEKQILNAISPFVFFFYCKSENSLRISFASENIY